MFKLFCFFNFFKTEIHSSEETNARLREKVALQQDTIHTLGKIA